MKFRLAVLILPALLLSACGDDTSTPAAEGDERTASGEVLEGSISDAMLPLDTVTSQPPLLKLEPKPEETAGDTDAQEAASQEAAAAAAGDAPPVAEPATPEAD